MIVSRNTNSNPPIIKELTNANEVIRAYKSGEVVKHEFYKYSYDIEKTKDKEENDLADLDIIVEISPDGEARINWGGYGNRPIEFTRAFITLLQEVEKDITNGTITTKIDTDTDKDTDKEQGEQ